MNNYTNLLQQALKSHQTGNLKTAEELYLKIYRQHQQNVDIVFLLGTLYLQSGKPCTATTFLQQAIQLKPDHAEAHHNLGTALQEQGKPDKAIECYQRALSLKPDFADAYFNLGNVFNKQHETEKAIGSYNKAILLKPDFTKAYSRLGTLFLEHGKLQDAAVNLNKAKSLDPKNAEIHNNLGIVLSRQGRLEEAVSCFQHAISLNPEDHKIHSNLASTLKESEKLEDAVASCKQAIKLNPHNAEAYNILGTICQKAGNPEDAVKCYTKAIEIKPDSSEIHNNLGSVLKELNRLKDAYASCCRAITLNPDNAEAHNNLGTILQEKGMLEKAAEHYRLVIRLKPDHALAHSNLGANLLKQGKIEEAVTHCRQAVSLNPNKSLFLNNLGAVLQEQGNFEEAMQYHNRALAVDPHNAEAYGNLGVIFKKQGKIEKALDCYRKSTLIQPDSAGAHKAAGILLEELGKRDEALHSYQASLRLNPDHGLEIKTILLHPVINNSRQSIHRYRESLIQRIKLLKHKKLSIEDPVGQVGSTNFYLAYHGLNDRELQEEIASLYISVCPDLTWTSPYLSKGGPQPYRKIKIGIISHYLTNHTIGLLNYGIIRNLSRERFYIKLFRFVDEKESSLSKAMNREADEVIVLPRKLKPARQIIAEHSPDILFYPEIGMDPFTYFLAFSRLAPVQCVTWGHPVTTGIPNIDYFISSEMAEITDAEQHYSEQLVLPDRLTTCYYPPRFPEKPRSRQYFGLSEGLNLYACPHTLFKFHPDFDHILGDLLRKDKHGLLLLIEGKYKNWTNMLRKRFSRTFSDVIDRVIFLPRMRTNDYLSLLNITDVLLDPIHFGGGNTTLEAFAFNIPVVTWPGNYLRSRLTLAFYRRLNIMDCVVNDKASYIDTAYRLANDTAWREEVTDKIRAHSDSLYEDMETVHELERFFEAAVEKAYSRNVMPEPQFL